MGPKHSPRAALLVVALLATGCLEPYVDTTGASRDYTDEDAGTGYEVDLLGEDLVSAPVQPGHYHPPGYSAVGQHGRDLKLQVQDCRTCHGQDLKGGTAPVAGSTITPSSCDTCHEANWRTNCTFCHGTTGGNGAPPRDLNGETNPAKISFPGHTAHFSARVTGALDCIQCHRKPTDVLTPYHVFDASPRRGENNLTGGLSAQAVYDPVQKQCNNTYCHGNGRVNGTIKVATAGPLACNACHADQATPAAWGTMSGDHRLHLNLNNTNCTSCHNNTVAANPSLISDKTLHIDAKREVAFAAGLGNIAYDPATRRCTGSCHGKNHNETW